MSTYTHFSLDPIAGLRLADHDLSWTYAGFNDDDDGELFEIPSTDAGTFEDPIDFIEFINDYALDADTTCFHGVITPEISRMITETQHSFHYELV